MNLRTKLQIATAELRFVGERQMKSAHNQSLRWSVILCLYESSQGPLTPILSFGHAQVLASPCASNQPRFSSQSLPVVSCTMSSLGSSGSSAPGSPRRPNVKYVSPAALNLERLYEQNRARLQQRDGALSPTNEMAAANAGKSKPRLLLMGQRRLAFPDTVAAPTQIT